MRFLRSFPGLSWPYFMNCSDFFSLQSGVVLHQVSVVFDHHQERRHCSHVAGLELFAWLEQRERHHQSAAETKRGMLYSLLWCIFVVLVIATCPEVYDTMFLFSGVYRK